jgi:hypothetical protein
MYIAQFIGFIAWMNHLLDRECVDACQFDPVCIQSRHNGIPTPPSVESASYDTIPCIHAYTPPYLGISLENSIRYSCIPSLPCSLVAPRPYRGMICPSFAMMIGWIDFRLNPLYPDACDSRAIRIRKICSVQ